MCKATKPIKVNCNCWSALGVKCYHESSRPISSVVEQAYAFDYCCVEIIVSFLNQLCYINYHCFLKKEGESINREYPNTNYHDPLHISDSPHTTMMTDLPGKYVLCTSSVPCNYMHMCSCSWALAYTNLFLFIVQDSPVYAVYIPT